jgi:hypothetical protein
MSTARLLDSRSALLSLLLELRYSIGRFQADPLASFCVQEFQSCRAECLVVQSQELDLLERLSSAQASVDIADENLDDFASRLSKAVLTITRDDRSHSIYLHFFGKKSISVFIRPKLGIELEAARGWGESLMTSQFPALQAMAAELTALLVAADAALAARSEAQREMRYFRDLGARHQLFDRVNASRKKAAGDLEKVAIETPGLPSDYDHRFFRAAPAVEEVAEPTVTSVREDIVDLETKLLGARELLVTLEAAAAAEKKAADEKASDEALLASLDKQADDLAKQKAALKAKLAKK